MEVINENKRKRSRVPNFSSEETRLLLNLALKEKSIIENKKTDSDTWKLKDLTWNKICENFNSTSGKTFRSSETLRSKYDSLKKDVKKKVIKNKQENMKTGGGTPDYIKIDGPEKELLEVLSITVSGLSSHYDSDNILPETTITGEVLDQEVHESLVLLPITEEEIRQALPLSGTLIDVLPNIESENKVQVEKSQPSMSSIFLFIRVSNKAEWNTWSPAQLKAKKHPVLTPKSRLTNNSKLQEILEIRDELLKNQNIHVLNEEKRSQEKHKKEIELLDINILIKKKELEEMEKK